ncbi:hypothetical protein ACX40Y_10890 [Sphingomonas sp. RS6]
MNDRISSLWRDDACDARPPDPAAMAAAEARLRRRVRRRDAIEYVAGGIGAATFVWIGWSAPEPLLRLACGMIVIGTAFTLWNLWRRRPKAPDPGLTSAAFYRMQLVAQREALASVWRWYLAPVVPGMLLFLLATGEVIGRTLPLRHVLFALATAGLPAVAVFVGIHLLNRRAARRVQSAIDALDRSMD